MIPAPTATLAVLIESEIWGATPEDQEFGYTWIIIPEFTNSKEFSLVLDKHISWSVVIRRLSDVDLDVYPIAGFDIPADFRFKKYAVGSPSSVVIEATSTPNLWDVWPDSSYSIPANGILVLNFEPLPKNMAVSHGRILIDDNAIKVVGPFPIGELELEIAWDDGSGSDTVRRIITEPDFKPPELLKTVAFSEDGFGVVFDRNDRIFPDTTRIELVFDEAIWVNEEIFGGIEIQTVAGDDIGWEEEFQLFSLNEIVLVRSNGRPLNPRTTYVLIGTVTDFANEIDIWFPFTTN